MKTPTKSQISWLKRRNLDVPETFKEACESIKRYQFLKDFQGISKGQRKFLTKKGYSNEVLNAISLQEGIALIFYISVRQGWGDPDIQSQEVYELGKELYERHKKQK